MRKVALAPRYPEDLGRGAFPCSVLLNLDPDPNMTDYEVEWAAPGILDGFGQRVLRVRGPGGEKNFMLSAAATAPPTAFFSVLARGTLDRRRPIGRS